MRKGSFGLVLLIFIIGIALGGCACFPKKAQEETPPAVVQTAPQRQPAVVQPAPPPKKDRN
jgi:starvation-inducible outer membrane lipoprotein